MIISCPWFRLTCYKSFIPLGVKDSSLRLYVCHHVERRGERREERKKESVAYHYRGLEWGRSCMLLQQAEVEVVHMVDMLAEKRKRESSAQESFGAVRCDVQLALAK